MAAIPKTLITEEAYLEQERSATSKSEYYNGEVFAMAGATKEHNKIVASIIIGLGLHLKGKKCSIFPSDIRVHNNSNSLYTYPDVTVVCGQEEYFDDKFDTLLNPTIIFEVLSPATEDYDRGTKFKLYRSIPSLQNFVLVSSTEYAAEFIPEVEIHGYLLLQRAQANIYISVLLIMILRCLTSMHKLTGSITLARDKFCTRALLPTKFSLLHSTVQARVV
jgi:Uma2 family endonuclease